MNYKFVLIILIGLVLIGAGAWHSDDLLEYQSFAYAKTSFTHAEPQQDVYHPDNKVYVNYEYINEYKNTTDVQLSCILNGNVQRKTVNLKPQESHVGTFIFHAPEHEGDYTIVLKGVADPDQDEQFIHHSRAEMEITVDRSIDKAYQDVKIKSNPDEARIYLDDRFYGYTPHLLKEVSTGKHELILEKAGYGTVTKTISVIKDADQTHEYSLTEQNREPSYYNHLKDYWAVITILVGLCMFVGGIFYKIKR